MTQSTVFRLIVRLGLTLALLGMAAGAAIPAAARPVVYTYANGINVPAGVGLPVYFITNPTVSADTTLVLTRVFNGIFNTSNTPLMDTVNGHPRFTFLNAENQSLLEQFGATGGFYAYNPERAFGSSLDKGVVLDEAVAQMHACRLLVTNPSIVTQSPDLSIPGLAVKCDNNFKSNPLYKVSTEFLDGQDPMGTPASSPTALRLMVTAPINVNTGLYSQVPTIPLGGPGGHISFIFDNTAPPAGAVWPSLDLNMPNLPAAGLQALAMPAYGRTLTINKLVPAVDPAVAKLAVTARVMADYPKGTNVNVPDPALAYYLSDASTPQGALEPDLFFSGISVDVDGQTQFLRDLVVPAVDGGTGGLGPSVSILTPTNGSAYMPSVAVNLKGHIADGVAPYIYQWTYDDGTVLDSGSLAAAGDVITVNKVLKIPDNKGAPSSLTLHLVVIDKDLVTREATTSLVTPWMVSLPMVTVGGHGVQLAPRQAAPQQPDYVYTFGYEYGSDYPPYGPGGPDLGGVLPDVNGLNSGLGGLGWPRYFSWGNANAWEKDWRDCSLGGDDCSYGVDRVDYAYYSGHGNNGGIAVPSNTHDSSWADGINARFSYARWVGFSSCRTLRVQGFTAPNEPIRKWFNAFQGAHMLLGFNSNMGDVAFGGPLVDNMRMPSFFGIDFPWAQRTIAEAWVQTAFQMNAGKPAYIYATSATVNPSGNKLPKFNAAPLPRPYPVNWFFWVWWNE